MLPQQSVAKCGSLLSACLEAQPRRTSGRLSQLFWLPTLAPGCTPVGHLQLVATPFFLHPAVGLTQTAPPEHVVLASRSPQWRSTREELTLKHANSVHDKAVQRGCHNHRMVAQCLDGGGAATSSDCPTYQVVDDHPDKSFITTHWNPCHINCFVVISEPRQKQAMHEKREEARRLKSMNWMDRLSSSNSGSESNSSSSLGGGGTSSGNRRKQQGSSQGTPNQAKTVHTRLAGPQYTHYVDSSHRLGRTPTDASHNDDEELAATARAGTSRTFFQEAQTPKHPLQQGHVFSDSESDDNSPGSPGHAER